jgi:preprotein translocase subunit SecG
MDFLKGQGQGQEGPSEGIGSKISSGLSSISSGLGDATPSTSSNSFYTIVLSIAVVVLIVVLAFLGWTISKQKETDNFPKLQTTCPDYWGISNDRGKPYCIQPSPSQINYGSADASKNASGFVDGKFDFANSGWSAGGNAVCAKKKWANSHGINWDTVTNANYC